MPESLIVGVVRQAIEVAILVSLPMLLAGLVAGVLVSVFQTVTSIQDNVLAFIPRAAAIFADVDRIGLGIEHHLFDCVDLAGWRCRSLEQLHEALKKAHLTYPTRAMSIEIRAFVPTNTLTGR